MLKSVRTLFLLLAVALLLAGLAACGGNNVENGLDYVPEIFEAYEPEESPEYAEAPDEVECDEEPEVIFETVLTGSDITGAIHRVEYGNNVAYLFGTIHLSMEHWFPLADVVEDALRRADVLLVEVDEVALDPMYMVEVMMDNIFLYDGQTWAEFLPEDAYEHLVALLPDWGMEYSAVNTFNPSFLLQTWSLGLMMEMAETAIDFGFTVDNYVADVALSLGMPVIGLESIRQQMEIVFNPPMEVLHAMIMDFASPEVLVEYLMESGELLFDDLALLYENNDFQAINDAFTRTIGPQFDCPYLTYMREVTMNWRSTYYANVIASLLRETGEPTTFFVAVGLSHINRSGAGEGFTDIVQQLGIEGFTVVPLW